MHYILYYSNGNQQELKNITHIYESRRSLRFVEAEGAELEVLKKFLIHYELIEDQAKAKKESVEDTFNRFDRFVHRFVDRVEQKMAVPHEKYSISMHDLNRFRTMMSHSHRAPTRVKAINHKL